MRDGLRVLSMVVLCAALPATAAELAGVTLPDRVEVDGQTLVLNGLGLREATMLKVDVYVAGLYVEQRSSDPETILASEGPKRLVMRFVRNVKKKDLVKAWDEGFEKNAGSELDALRPRIDTFNGLMTDVKKGDTLTLTWTAGAGLEVAINGGSRGSIDGADFARVLWSIWLGPEPPNAGLKEGLLGGG